MRLELLIKGIICRYNTMEMEMEIEFSYRPILDIIENASTEKPVPLLYEMVICSIRPNTTAVTLPRRASHPRLQGLCFFHS